MLGDDLRPYLGQSSSPKPTSSPPPPYLFSASACVTFSVAHILVIREDWLTAAYCMKMGVGIKILIELLATEIHHSQSLG